ncbi:MAG: hypothetical protein IJR95_09335 [Lachnospiraceae bacterium]|nr:hypothetical protein [Lachnospiraceae bacterium]
MTEFFLRILENSLSACWLVAAVLLVRLLFQKAPQKLFPLLWSLVGLRLMLPFKAPSPFSLVPQVPVDRGAMAFPVLKILQVLWLPVFLGLLALGLISYLRLRRKLNTAVRCGADLWKSEQVHVPFVLGSLRPRIYLPFGLKPEDEANILRHERAHIRRGDHRIKPLAFLLLAMNWFNPLIWVSYWLLAGDMELACDELAAESLTRRDRASYSETLLKCSLSEKSIWVCPLAFGTRRLKKRIRLVTEGRKYTRPVRLACLSIILVLSFCFLTDPLTKEKIRDRELSLVRDMTAARDLPARTDEAADSSPDPLLLEDSASYPLQKEEKQLRGRGIIAAEPMEPVLPEKSGEAQETLPSHIVLLLSQNLLSLTAIPEGEGLVLAAGEWSVAPGEAWPADAPAQFCIVVPDINGKKNPLADPYP